MVDLTNLTDDQLDFLENAHKKGLGGLSDDELNRLDSIVNPSRMQRLGQAISNTVARLKPIGVGLAKAPGAIADVLNQTTSIGKEPDLTKGIPEGWKGINLSDPNAIAPMPKEDDSYAGAIGKKIRDVTGYKPQDALDEYLEAAGTGAGVSALSPGAGLRLIPRMIYGGAVPQIAAKGAGDIAAAAGASPTVQQGASFATGLFSPYIAMRARTPLPVTDQERRAATRTLNQAGINTTAGQDTGRQWLLDKEGTYLPKKNEEQSRQFTSAATAPLGRPTEAATIGQGGYMPTIDRAIKRNMDDVSSRNNINLGVMSPHERLDIRSELEQLARDNPRHVGPILDEIEKHTGWTPNMIGAPTITNPRQAAAERIWRTLYPGARAISGDDYQRLRSQFHSAASDLASSNPTLAESFRNMARSLDKGMRYSIARQNPADSGAFENARQLLENNMIVQKARSSQRGGADQIKPDKLEKAAKNIIGDRRYNAGDTPYQPLATAAQKALPEIPGGEGVGKRAFHSTALATGMGALAGTGTVAYGMLKGMPYKDAFDSALYPLFATPMAAAGPSWMAHKAVTSRPGQRYLRNQVIPAVPQNAGARARNAVIQALTAGQQRQ